MRINKVDCANCTRFTYPEIEIGTWKQFTPAKCEKDKRVMFRMPTRMWEDGGWFRYCKEFNDKMNDNIQ